MCERLLLRAYVERNSLNIFNKNSTYTRSNFQLKYIVYINMAIKSVEFTGKIYPMLKSRNNISHIIRYSFNQLRLSLRTFSLSIFLENFFLSIPSSFFSSFAIGGRGNELITNNNNNHGPNTMSFKN